jgi:hypothetical protein
MEITANKIENLFIGCQDVSTCAFLNINGRDIRIQRRLNTSGGQRTIAYSAPSLSHEEWWDSAAFYEHLKNNVNNVNLEKIKQSLPELEAEIKKIAGAEIKLNARIETSIDGDRMIVLFSDDLKNQITSGIAAPIFKSIYIKTWGGTIRNNAKAISFSPKIQYEHYSGGTNGTDYIWSSLRFDLSSGKWMFDESRLIYTK